MDDGDDVLAPYEAELASDRVVQALLIKLSWQPKPSSPPEFPEQTGADD